MHGDPVVAAFGGGPPVVEGGHGRLPCGVSGTRLILLVGRGLFQGWFSYLVHDDEDGGQVDLVSAVGVLTLAAN